MRRTLGVAVLTTATAVAIAGCTGSSGGSSRTSSASGDSGSPSTVPVSGTASSSAACSTTPAGGASTPAADSAAKLPNAGYVFVINQGDNSGGSVSVIKPGSTSIATISLGNNPGEAAIAPAGTPNAGTAYINNFDGSVSVVAPDATTATTVQVGPYPDTPVIAPAGTPNAGTVYVVNSGSDTAAGSISVIDPKSNSVTATIPLNGTAEYRGSSGYPVVAPAGTPEAGTLYLVTGDKTHPGVLNVLPPNAASPTLIPVGKEDPADDGAPVVLVAPAGTPGAGTVYVINGADGSMDVVAPGASSVERSMQIGETLRVAVVAPAGTPNAGTIYVLRGNEDGTLEIVPPNATAATTVKLPGSGSNNAGSLPNDLVLVPPGVPGAGTVYLSQSDGTYSTLAPNSIKLTTSSMTTKKSDPPTQTSFVVAPAGTPNAGTVFMLGNDNTMAILKPCATSVSVINVNGFSEPVIAPAGAPNAGTVYLLGSNPANSVSVLAPGATTAATISGVGSADVSVGVLHIPHIAGNLVTGANTDEGNE